MTTSATHKTASGPVEYFRAKLEYEVSPEGLRILLERAPELVFVLDVRSREEYDAGHIPGARSVPVDSLVSAFASLPKNRVIVTCGADASCSLAARAALELAQKRFRVQSLIGGAAEWSRKGYPLEPTLGEAPSQAW